MLVCRLRFSGWLIQENKISAMASSREVASGVAIIRPMLPYVNFLAVSTVRIRLGLSPPL